MKIINVKGIDFELKHRNQCAIDANRRNEKIELTANELQHIITEAAMYGNENYKNYERG